MRTIEKNRIGQELLVLIQEEEPFEEDIGILDESGNVAAMVITPQMYDFLLKKIDEEDERLGMAALKKFHESGEADQ